MKDEDRFFGRATVRATVTLDLVVDGQLVTIHGWATLGDKRPIDIVPSIPSLVRAAEQQASAAAAEAARELTPALRKAWKP